jgi:hypothetical protein
MHVLRLADQKVAAMDKVHFYVCQTDANMSYYLTKAVTDSGRCTHDEMLRLMYACSQDNDIDEVDSDNEDDEESVVEDDADKEVTSLGKESGENGSDEDDDSAGAFTSDAIGAGRGQLQQVTPCILYNFVVVKTNILSDLLLGVATVKKSTVVRIILNPATTGFVVLLSHSKKNIEGLSHGFPALSKM